MTYDELILIAEAEMTDLDASWDDHKDELIERAQLRIENDLDIIASRKEVSVTATSADLSLPDDLVVLQHLRLNQGDHLLQKDRAFLREFWPVPGLTGTPRYYAFKDDSTLLLAPTPVSQSLDLTYTARLPVLSAAEPTNWLSTEAPNLLQYSLFIELAIWTKDPELLAVYKGEYSRALSSTAITYNLRQRMGEYRTGAPVAREGA